MGKREADPRKSSRGSVLLPRSGLSPSTEMSPLSEAPKGRREAGLRKSSRGSSKASMPRSGRSTSKRMAAPDEDESRTGLRMNRTPPIDIDSPNGRSPGSGAFGHTPDSSACQEETIATSVDSLLKTIWTETLSHGRIDEQGSSQRRIEQQGLSQSRIDGQGLSQRLIDGQGLPGERNRRRGSSEPPAEEPDIYVPPPRSVGPRHARKSASRKDPCRAGTPVKLRKMQNGKANSHTQLSVSSTTTRSP